jgi:hypothetical protein
MRPHLNLDDLELLHHFTWSTSLTLYDSPEIKRLWQVTTPCIAVRHPFLMHGILAMAAMHLHRLKPELGESYLIKAARHQSLSLAAFRQELGDIHENNYKALFLFAGLLVHYSFASPKTPGSLGVTDKGLQPSEWVHLLRGGHATMKDVWKWLPTSDVYVMVAMPLKLTLSADLKIDTEAEESLSNLARLCPFPNTPSVPYFVDDYTPAFEPTTTVSTLTSTTQTPPNGISVGQRRKLQVDPGWPVFEPEPYGDAVAEIYCKFYRTKHGFSEAEVYAHTVADLRVCYRVVEYLSQSRLCMVAAVFCWPVMVPPTYFDLLTRGTPQSLIILAHYVVLLHYIDDFWWMEGWTKQMLDTIEGLLDESWRPWIEWPLKVVRGAAAARARQGGSNNNPPSRQPADSCSTPLSSTSASSCSFSSASASASLSASASVSVSPGSGSALPTPSSS